MVRGVKCDERRSCKEEVRKAITKPCKEEVRKSFTKPHIIWNDDGIVHSMQEPEIMLGDWGAFLTTLGIALVLTHVGYHLRTIGVSAHSARKLTHISVGLVRSGPIPRGVGDGLLCAVYVCHRKKALFVKLCLTFP